VTLPLLAGHVFCPTTLLRNRPFPTSCARFFPPAPLPFPLFSPQPVFPPPRRNRTTLLLYSCVHPRSCPRCPFPSFPPSIDASSALPQISHAAGSAPPRPLSPLFCFFWYIPPSQSSDVGTKSLRVLLLSTSLPFFFCLRDPRALFEYSSLLTPPFIDLFVGLDTNRPHTPAVIECAFSQIHNTLFARAPQILRYSPRISFPLFSSGQQGGAVFRICRALLSVLVPEYASFLLFPDLCVSYQCPLWGRER